MKFIVLAFFCFAYLNSFGQSDAIGSGRAMVLDGVDDYVSYGDVYHDVNLPFSISAWVFLDPSSGVNPVFCTNDNPVVYKGFIFFVTPSTIGCEFGDGTGGNNPAFRRGKIAQIPNVLGRWIHVCAVMTAPFVVDLYINGINVGGDSSGGSLLPMKSSIPGDIAKSGYYISNSTTYRFKGMIDEVRLYNRALSQDEVRLGMCKKLTGTESGLIGYWTFDETSGSTVFDKSKNGFNGVMQGNPQRVYSGAPIGDDSKYLYQSNWSGTTLSMIDGPDQMSASNVQGAPEGLQIYEVKSWPSQSGGVNLSTTSPPYFGVFSASLDTDNTFTSTYYFQNSVTCKSFNRGDNSINNWSSTANPLTNVAQRVEVLKDKSNPALTFSLGPDISTCTLTPFTLNPFPDPTGLTFTWQDNSHQPTFYVNSFGTYWVTISNGCVQSTDTLKVVKSGNGQGPIFNLGPDVTTCVLTPFTLIPFTNPTGLTFTWQDNSHQSTFAVTDFGKYWVTVSNGCSQTTDTINIMRSGTGKNTSFNLGTDVRTCVLSPFALTPFPDPTGLSFTWQDNSHQSTFTVTDFGKYWVTVSNGCVSYTDTIRFTKAVQQVGFLPNVITPNGDSFNQYFKVDDSLNGNVNLKVINRWGKEVYQSLNYKNNWDGSDLDSGTYYVLISGGCLPAVVKEWITIIR